MQQLLPKELHNTHQIAAQALLQISTELKQIYLDQLFYLADSTSKCDS